MIQVSCIIECIPRPRGFRFASAWIPCLTDNPARTSRTRTNSDAGERKKRPNRWQTAVSFPIHRKYPNFRLQPRASRRRGKEKNGHVLKTSYFRKPFHIWQRGYLCTREHVDPIGQSIKLSHDRLIIHGNLSARLSRKHPIAPIIISNCARLRCTRCTIGSTYTHIQVYIYNTVFPKVTELTGNYRLHKVER